MKRLFYTALTLTCLLVSCNEVDDTINRLLTFSVDHQIEFTIRRATPLNLPLEILTPDVTTNSSQVFENNGTRGDLVKDVSLEALKLSIIAPDGKTFSFLKSIQIFISTTASDEIELAQLDNIAENATTLELIPTDEKLDRYVKASSYRLRTVVVTRETLSEDVSILADMSFKVTADPI